MAYNFNRNFGQTRFQPFQSGGKVTGDRASKRYKYGTDIMKTNWQAQEDWEEEQERQGFHGFLTNLFGVGAQFLLPMLLPGIGTALGAGGSKIFDWLIKSQLGKAVTSLGSKALVKGIGTAMYEPGEYESPTPFGKQTFADIGASGEDYKKAGYMGAGTEFLTDLLMSQMPSPFTGTKQGSLSEQVGLKPFEFGGYTNPYVNTTGVPLDMPVRPKVPMPADTPEMIGNIIPMRPKIPMPFDTPDMLGNLLVPSLGLGPAVKPFGGNPAIEMGAYGQQDSLSYLQKLLNLLPNFKKGRDLSNDPYLPYE